MLQRLGFRVEGYKLSAYKPQKAGTQKKKTTLFSILPWVDLTKKEWFLRNT